MSAVTPPWPKALPVPSVLALCLVAVCLCSCLQVEQTVVLRADGSGTQKTVLAMTERALSSARAFAQARNAAFDPAELFDARRVRAELAEAGLSCRKVEASEKRRRRVLEVEAAFAGVSALQKSPLSGSGAEWRLTAGPTTGTARLVYFPMGEKAWRAATEKASKMSASMDDREKAMFERRLQDMRGLDVRWTLELPGDVIGKPKGLLPDGKRKVVATITAERIRSPRDLVLSLAPRYEVVFDSRQCTFPLAAPAKARKTAVRSRD